MDGADFPEEAELREKVKTILNRHKTVPSCVHGDLWAGNFGATKEGDPVIYDPAFYFGDREVDIAMSKLFGSQSKAFYDAYNKTFPLADEWEIRETIYNLYHILNHFVLFGGGYLSQGNMMIGKILKYNYHSS
jgi:fructosamine-3-kinase